MSDSVHPVAVVTARILQDLGTTGAALTLWSLVTCCALVRGDSACLALVWPEVFAVWVSLAGPYLLVFAWTRYTSSRYQGMATS